MAMVVVRGRRGGGSKGRGKGLTGLAVPEGQIVCLASRLDHCEGHRHEAAHNKENHEKKGYAMDI